MNDNRNYRYEFDSVVKRDEYSYISDWIPKHSYVIDLGCGDGSLLALLHKGGIKGTGIDISKSAVISAKKKGIKIEQGRIDVPLKFKESQFDYAICNVTLQMVIYPEVLLSEMRRIAKKLIITFPNFAFILNRLDLLLYGRMPRIMIPGYEWFNTGHIHQLSIKDFEDFCKINNLNILKTKHIYPNKIICIPEKILKKFPNLFAVTGIYLLGK